MSIRANAGGRDRKLLDGLTANATQSTAELNTHESDPNAHHMPGGGGAAFSIPGLDDQDTPVAADDLFGVWDASDGATEKVTAGVIRTFMQDGLAGGLSLSDADPANVGDARSSGRWFGGQPKQPRPPVAH